VRRERHRGGSPRARVSENPDPRLWIPLVCPGCGQEVVLYPVIMVVVPHPFPAFPLLPCPVSGNTMGIVLWPITEP
jgi:hypothetical protein